MSKNVKAPFEFDAILNRLMSVYQVKKNIDLCKKLNLSPQTLSTWRGRNKIPFELCVKVALEQEVSLDWLLLGREEMSSLSSSYDGAPCSRQTIDTLRMHELEIRLKELEQRILNPPG